MEKIEVDKLQLEALIEQNKKMKAAIKKAHEKYLSVSELIDLKKIAERGNLTLALPKVLRKVMNNPAIFEGMPEILIELEEFI